MIGEKKVLHFLKDCATKAAKVLKMNRTEAYKEIDSWDDSSKIVDYFRRTIAAQLVPEAPTLHEEMVSKQVEAAQKIIMQNMG